MDIYQLCKFIIYPVINTLGLYSSQRLRIMAGTVGKESSGGNFLIQTSYATQPAPRSPFDIKLSGGLGIFQNEALTHSDTYRNFINYRPDLLAKMETLLGPRVINGKDTYRPERCVYDLNYAAAMCAIRYLRAPGAIPDSVEAQAIYWKKYYNTKIEVNDADVFVQNYNRLCAADVNRFLGEIGK